MIQSNKLKDNKKTKISKKLKLWSKVWISTQSQKISNKEVINKSKKETIQKTHQPHFPNKPTNHFLTLQNKNLNFNGLLENPNKSQYYNCKFQNQTLI